MTSGAEKFGGGIASYFVGTIGIFIDTVIGTVMGVPTTWGLTKLFMSPNKKFQKVLEPVLHSDNAKYLNVRGSFVDFRHYLELALEPIK